VSVGNAARHRAARRPVTPLTEIAQAVSSGAGKRAAVVATAGGLIISTFGGAAAQAAPANDASTKLNAVDLGALTDQARAALAAAPAVTVAADVHVETEAPSADGAGAVAVTPAPKPRPVVQPRATAASRTTERAAETPAAAPAVDVAAFANGSAVVEVALRYVGVPYVSGGSSPAGFDCSGFTQYVFAQVGISLPRTSGAQRNVGTIVSRADAQPGDLIWSPGHVAIYVGNGQQIDAPRPGKTIQVRSIWQSSPTFIRL
jgi:cell wall-associated NlpC family hydrolase